MHAWIVLHFTYQRPVGFAGIHLCPGTAVDSQCFNATILQLFCQFNDDLVFGIPAQTGFYRYRNLDGIYDSLGYFQHFRNILQHT